MTDKIAVVTGASRGLGAAVAEALAPDFHIVAVARTTGALEELDDRIRARGGEATLAPMDITTDAAMQQLCRGIYDRWGHVDLWVHAAIHAAPLAAAQDVSAKDFDASVAVNITATQRLIRYLAPLMDETGRAVFFDDDRAGAALWSSYGATKAAQIALARSWQGDQLGPDVMIAAPPPMPTASRARHYPGDDRSGLTPVATVAAVLVPQITSTPTDAGA